MGDLYQHATQDARTLLGALGVGNFTATMVIPYVFMTPTTTDPQMSQIMILVQGLQRGLNRMGADLEVNGFTDIQTAVELRKVAGGADWVKKTWFELYKRVVAAIDQGVTLTPFGPAMDEPVPVATDGIDDLVSNPLVLAAGAAAAWFLFFRKKR